MSLQRVIQRTSLSVALVAGVAPIAFAQAYPINLPRVAAVGRDNGTELFEWTGRVDREVQIVMRGSDVWTNNVGATEYPRARSRTYTRIPSSNGQVVVQLLDGRGDVDVIQQPSRRNDYTTIVRVRDPRSGSDSYRLAAYWQGDYSGDVYGRHDNGRHRGQDVYRDRDDDGRNDNNNNGRYGQSGRTDQEALHWSGNVDNELEIRLQNGRVEYRTLSGAQPTNVRANPGNAGVRYTGTVSIVQNSGRGSVSVVQQPSQWNNYTTVIRVRDPQGGYGFYDFSVVAQ